MKGILPVLLMLAVIAPPGALARGAASGGAPSVAAVADSLSKSRCVEMDASFTVSQPQLSEDVVYSLYLLQEQPAVASDTTLFPCSYLIDWHIEGRQRPVRGFSAYFSGNHFRFSGEKLQEYHAADDSVPFRPAAFGAASSRGVQQSARFVDLLPVSIAGAIGDMLTNPSYKVTFTPDTLVGGKRSAVLSAVMDVRGETAREVEYVLDPSTLFPRSAHFENNPGSISEQTIDVAFSAPRFPAPCPEISETALIGRYPDVFARLRQSSYSLKNLVGHPLPSFTAPTPTGERYFYESGSPFPSTMAIAVIDPSSGYAREVVERLRQAIAGLPYSAGLVMAFTGTNADLIEEIAGTPAEGEAILQSARGIARDFGAPSLPAVLIVDRKGIVRNVILGFNNNLASDVIQKMILIP